MIVGLSFVELYLLRKIFSSTFIIIQQDKQKIKVLF